MTAGYKKKNARFSLGDNENKLFKDVGASVSHSLNKADIISVDVSTPILSYYRSLQKSSDSLKDIAQKVHHHKQNQIHENIYSQDFYTLSGSKACADIKRGDNPSKECIIWSINHYTGLNRDLRVIEAAKEALDVFGTGSGTSALSCGHSSIHKEIEARLASCVGKEDAMFFSTGYSTNVGAIAGLATKQDLVIFDRECHASIIDGIKLSGATYIPFRHNDILNLQLKLQKYGSKYKNVFVMVESAYSMSGDLAPLIEICEIKKLFNFYLYVDEAHTFGIYGKAGAGYCAELGVTEQVDFLMSTLSKSTASMGGFLACDSAYRSLLEWSANAYIFQAAATPSDTAAILKALDIIESEPELIKRIHDNNAYMRQAFLHLGLDLKESESPIIPIYINDMDVLQKISLELFNQGIFTVSVIYPAVKHKEGRLRFIVTASHTREQIDKTVDTLEYLMKSHDLI